MGLIQFVVILAIVGFLLWLIETKIPMDATIKRIIQIVVIAAVIIYVLYAFGILPFHDIRIMPIR